MRKLGIAVLAIYFAHVAELLATHPPGVLLWSCDVATVVVAIGLLAPSPMLNAAGALMLIVGLPMWAISVALGEPLLWTAPLMHAGVPAIAIVAMRKIGLPRRSWIPAALFMIAATIAARLFTDPAENVNLAHAVPHGFERLPLPVYFALLAPVLLAATIAVEALLRRFALASPADPAG